MDLELILVDVKIIDASAQDGFCFRFRCYLGANLAS